MSADPVVRRGRGRPRKPDALSPAEKQAAYRARLAARRLSVDLAPSQVDSLMVLLLSVRDGLSISIPPDVAGELLSSVLAASARRVVARRPVADSDLCLCGQPRDTCICG